MDVEDMFDLDTILFKQRKCRACGKNKDLTDLDQIEHRYLPGPTNVKNVPNKE